MADPTKILWQVAFYGREAMPATFPYSFENRHRGPVGHCIFQIVEAGQVEIRDLKGNWHLATPGHAFIFRNGDHSAYRFPKGNRLPYITQWIDLEGAGLIEHWDALLITTCPVVPVTDELRSGMRHLAALAEPQARCSPPAMAAAVHAFVMQLVTSVDERHRLTLTPVEQAIDDLCAKPAAAWSLKEVAERHGISREHLTRAFLARVGQSPAAWLNQARVAKACHLLGQTDIELSDVAVQAGFSSAHTLARLIKQATGLSPRLYRQKRREKRRDKGREKS